MSGVNSPTDGGTCFAGMIPVSITNFDNQTDYIVSDGYGFVGQPFLNFIATASGVVTNPYTQCPGATIAYVELYGPSYP